MLVLTRRIGESIIIGQEIEVVVLGTEGDKVRIGIRAPREVDVYRKEVYESIRQSNQEAATSTLAVGELSQVLQKMKKSGEI